MAQQILNQFSQFEMTETEQLAGEMLSVPQVQVIRNLLAGEALKRLGLMYDPTNPMQFMQAEAEIQGAMGAYTLMLETSDLAFGNASDIATDEAASNNDSDFVVSSEVSVTQRIFDV